MPVTPEWTEDQLRVYVDDKYDEDQAQHDEAWALIQRWLARGDGAAVYENHDLGHPGIGLCKIASFGSPAAQLEMTYPPDRLPDTRTDINWRYVLIATCRREPRP
jgi:hypothetical protein